MMKLLTALLLVGGTLLAWMTVGYAAFVCLATAWNGLLFACRRLAPGSPLARRAAIPLPLVGYLVGLAVILILLAVTAPGRIGERAGDLPLASHAPERQPLKR